MRAELFSIRRIDKEIAEINENSQDIFRIIARDTDAQFVFKNDVEYNPDSVIDAVAVAMDSDLPADMFVFVNGIHTPDSSSFLPLFGPLVDELEGIMGYGEDFVEDDVVYQNHVNIYSFSCPKTENKGYCFYLASKRFIFLPSHSESKAPLIDFLRDGINNANAVLNDKWKQYPEGCIRLEKEKCPVNTEKKSKGIKGFFMSFIPQKGDRAGIVVSKILVLVAIVALLVGGYLLLDFFVLSSVSNEQIMDEIQQIFYDTTETETISTVDESGNTVVVPIKNWKKLNKINDEITSWIKVSGTKIDYPVLYHKGDNADAQFYLYRNYKKEYSDFGSIFVDYRCTKVNDSKNYILHGHNMGTDDSMFGQLIDYAKKDGSIKGNTEFYKKAPIVTIDTPEGSREYIIFSIIKLDVANQNENVLNYIQPEFDSDARFMNYIYNLKIRSYLDVPVPINENDNMLTLSTCSYETKNMRTVAFAREVRDGEDVSKYIKAVKAQTPVELAESTFSTELAAKNIKWYDGKGNLKGEEDIEYFEKSDMYIVKYVNAEGKTISHQQVLKGKSAKPPKTTPRKKADDKYYYVFKKWDHSPDNIMKDLIIKPVFEKKLRNPDETTTDATEAATDPFTNSDNNQAQVNPDPVETEAPKPVQTTPAGPASRPPSSKPKPKPTQKPTEAPETEAPATTAAPETQAPADTTAAQ